MRAAVLVLLLCTAAAPAVANPSANPMATLEEGKLSYQRHEYGKVVDTVYPLLYPNIELSSEEAVVEAHRLLGLSYFFLKKTGDAEQEMSSLLQLRPAYQLNPIVEPPVAVSFFNRVRDRQDARLSALRQRQQQEDQRARREEEQRRSEARARAERVFVDRRIIKRSRLVALLPFGIGQIQNGRRGKAIAFGVTEGLLGMLSLATWIAIGQRFPAGRYAPADEQLARATTGLQLASGAAFWAVVLWGIIDAQVQLVPESVTTHEREPTKKLSIVPLLPSNPHGTWGIGINGAF